MARAVSTIPAELHPLYSSDFLHFLFESIGRAVIVTNVDGTIVRWNRAAERLYGWSSQEVVGRQILEVTPSEQSLEEAESIMRQLRAGHTWSGAFPVRRRDGSTFVAIINDAPVRDAEGQLIAIVGISSDVEDYAATITDQSGGNRRLMLAPQAPDEARGNPAETSDLRQHRARDLLLGAEEFLAAAHAALTISRPLLAATAAEELDLVRMMRLSLDEQGGRATRRDIWHPLSARDQAYAARLASGMPEVVIARELGISTATVRRAVRRMLMKLDLEHPGQLVAWLLTDSRRRVLVGSLAAHHEISTEGSGSRPRRRGR